MLISYINKLNIEDDFADTFNKKGITISKHFSTPTPFNNLLWYVVAYKDSGLYVGHHSVFDEKDEIEFHFHPMNTQLLAEASNQDDVEELKTFSQGFYIVEKWKDTLVFNDVRFGQIMGWENPDNKFTFHYILEPETDNTMVVQRGRFQNWNRKTIAEFLARIRGDK